MTVQMSGTLWRVKNPNDINDWVAATELAANEYKRKSGQQPTHINVLEPSMALRLEDVYADQGYKFIIGSRLPNEVLVGVVTRDGDKGTDDLVKYKQAASVTTVKEFLGLSDEEEAEVEAMVNEHKNGVRPESEADDKPVPVYDKESNTLTYGGIRFLDVYPEDVMKVTKDPEHFNWMREMYDWVEEGDTSA